MSNRDEKLQWVMRTTWQSAEREAAGRKPDVRENAYVKREIAEHAARDRLMRINDDGYEPDRSGRLLRVEIFQRSTRELFNSVVWDHAMKDL